MPKSMVAWLAMLTLALSGCGEKPPETQPPETPGTAAGTAAETPGTAGEPAAEHGGSAARDLAGLDEPRGLRLATDAAAPGYVLFAPLLSDTTYLIDAAGKVIHTWKSEYAPSSGVYLSDDGNLLRGARVPDAPVFSGGGQGGRLEERTWDGELVWEFELATEDHLLHHDVEILPNGNVLAIAWERKSRQQALQAGRRPDLVPEAGVWPDKILELEPRPPDGAAIVWEWHMWDHLVQDSDASLANHGDPGAHPELIDVNGDGKPLEVTAEELEQLKALGYVPEDTTAEDVSSDLLHTNSVDYHPELDQIVLSVPRVHEIWVIDHGTTTAEAAGHTGGRRGRGGDLLYRWGNPKIYRRGDASQQLLFAQHDAQWIPAGFPGAGNLTVFSNESIGPEGKYSAVYEIAPPLDATGRYTISEGAPFGPAEPAWSYTAPDKTSFFAPFISGAHRLANGNTLITSGPQGRFFEVTPAGEIVWEYWTPYSGKVRMPDGSLPHPVGPFGYGVFRATKIPPDHPALEGRNLAPLVLQPPAVPHSMPPDEGSSG